jgi:hypothetical protein
MLMMQQITSMPCTYSIHTFTSSSGLNSDATKSEETERCSSSQCHTLNQSSQNKLYMPTLSQKGESSKEQVH